MAISFNPPGLHAPRRSAYARSLARERLLGVLGLVFLALLSLYAGRAVANGYLLNAAALAMLPLLAVIIWLLSGRARRVLLFAAFGLNLIPFLDISRQSLLGPIYLADVLVALALLTWIADRLSGSKDAVLPRTPVIGWPLMVFGVALVPGLVAGSERFGANFFGQPLRLVFYAAIVTTLTRLTAQEAYRGIVIVFYAGTVLQTLAAGYYLATGQAGTDAVGLSTGGSRVLALTAAMYLAGALVLALFNLQLDPRRWGLHIVMAGLALFGIVVTYGRTTYIAVAVLLVVLFALLGEMRRAVALSLPVVVPVVVIVVLLLPSLAPEVIPTFTERINPSVETDSSYAWRQEAVEATLAATAEDRLLGGGFGATRTFSVETQVHTIGGDPHNSFVYLLSGGGIVALVAFCLLLLVYFVDSARRLWRARGTERALVGFSLAIVFVFLVNMLTGPILTVPVLVLTFWAALVLPSLVTPRPAENPD